MIYKAGGQVMECRTLTVQQAGYSSLGRMVGVTVKATRCHMNHIREGDSDGI